jgi:hypothetical protein
MRITYKIRIEVLEMFLFSSMSREEISEKTGVRRDTVSEIVNKYHKDGDSVIMGSSLNGDIDFLVKDFKKMFPYAHIITRRDIMNEFGCSHKVCTNIINTLINKNVLIRNPHGYKFTAYE